MRRFYCATQIRSETVLLTDTEAHHLAHVLRHQLGEQVVLFDGSGREFIAEVQELRRREVQLRIVSNEVVSRELDIQIVLAVALPRGDRQDWLAQKAVELGVAELIPLQTERVVAIPSKKSQTRLQRTVIEASKQCGRNQLMQVHSAAQFTDLIVQSTAGWRLIAQPSRAGRPLGEIARQHDGSQQSVCVAIGPEGGFTDEELRLAQDHGWQMIDLGSRILRTETAALAVAARLALG